MPADLEPRARLRRAGDLWYCIDVNPAWSTLASVEREALLGEPLAALLADRLVAEGLARLCDLAALTRTRRRVAVPPIADLPRLAVAVPMPSEGDGEDAVEIMLSLDALDGTGLSHEQMQDALDADTPRLVATFDRSLRVTSVNDAVILVSGLSRDEMVGKTNSEMGYPPAVADLWDVHHRKVFETGHPRLITYSLPTVIGFRDYETEVRPQPGAHGEVREVVVISCDVTSRHLRREVHRRRANEDVSWVPAMWEAFEPVAAAPREARRAVVEWLVGVGCDDLADEVALVLSELATNAVMHARTAFYVQAELIEDGVRVEVYDGVQDMPVERRTGDIGGRGLTLVESLTTRWGAHETPTRGGKTVWCEILRRDVPGPSELSIDELFDLWGEEDLPA